MTPARGTTAAHKGAHETAHKTSRTRTRAKADVSSAKTAATAASSTPQKVPAKAAATSTVKQTRPLGHVTFVGVGPGDPSLLTLAGRDVLANADAVVVEGPEHNPFLAYCRAGVEVIDGSGAEGSRALKVAARARLVVKTAKTSANVVRLLTGDPFTFSSGAEELADAVSYTHLTLPTN